MGTRWTAGRRRGLVGAIVHALAFPKPRSRYIVGNIARQIAVVSLLPDSIRDWLMLRHLGIWRLGQDRWNRAG